MIWEPYEPPYSIYVRNMLNNRGGYYLTSKDFRDKTDFRCGECNEIWTNDQNDGDTDTCPWCQKISHRLHRRNI